MQLPAALRKGIERELAACDGGKLRAASARLSECYRESATSNGAPSNSAALSTPEQQAAYLAVRLPATYAAVVAALGWAEESCAQESDIQENSEQQDNGRESGALEIRTMLDLGSGPGTAVWAACEVFPALESVTAIERDSKLIEIARRLAGEATHAGLRNTAWMQGDLTAGIPEGSWDLVVCSYALNELHEAQRAEFMRKAWARTGKLLVVVEPGTKTGFANILAVRTRLLNEGAGLVAPCPNALACPMANDASSHKDSRDGDWCHFAARIERTADHRRLKDATLGHEDEKFSYVAFSRRAVSGDAVALPGARIVRHPKVFSGYTQLTLCREGAIAKTTVTRSKKEDWRRLKRLGWGDRW